MMIQAKEEPPEEEELAFLPHHHWDYRDRYDSGIESARSFTAKHSSPERATDEQLEQYTREEPEEERKHAKGTSSAASSSSASGSLCCAVCGDAAFCYHYGVNIRSSGIKTFILLV